MMTKTRFHRINGHDPVVEKDPIEGSFYAYCECDCDGAAKTISGTPSYSESGALASLLYQVLQEHGRIVCEQQGWQCHSCGRVVPLSGHHKVRRSKERSDKLSALHGLCSDCHRREHPGPQALSKVNLLS